jgi:hypothetical protein
MPEIKIDKLYKNEHKGEPCFIGFPLPEGKLSDPEKAALYCGGLRLPSQAKATARWKDGSVKFLFLRFLADTPANRAMTVDCDLEGKKEGVTAAYHPVRVSALADGFRIETEDDGGSKFAVDVKHDSERIFERVSANGKTYEKERFEGPVLREKGQAGSYAFKTEKWEIAEEGPVCAILKTKGVHTLDGSGKKLGFEIRQCESEKKALCTKIYNGVDSASTDETDFGKAKILDGKQHYYSLVIHKKHLDISVDGKSIRSTDLKLSSKFYGLNGFELGNHDLGQLIVYSFGNFIRKENEKNWMRLKAWQHAFYELQKKAKETSFEHYQKF